MGDEINAVLAALNIFSNEFADKNAVKWGFIYAPTYQLGSGEKAIIVSDLEPFDIFYPSPRFQLLSMYWTDQNHRRVVLKRNGKRKWHLKD